MVRVITGILVQCDAPLMVILEKINQERHFIVYRISETDVVVKEGCETWLEDEIVSRLEKAEKGNTEDVMRWRDKC